VRATEQEQTGGAGVSEVTGKFQRIGWGPVPNDVHDLGTDLFVQARDSRRFDRGLIVGAQVKAGPTWFEDEERDENGQVLGWWYYEPGAEHFDAWVIHCLPHLLVLHDLDNDVSHWVHVTAERVTRTGRGCKILVPADQTIDLEHVDDLLAVAGRQRAAPTIEGTAFGASAGTIPPARQLRFALIAPRLVAPHPNLGFDRPITPEEALALIAQGRLDDLVDFAARHAEVPDPRHEAPSRDWRWSFVRAVWLWATTEDIVSLRDVVAQSPDTFSQAASAVILGCALLRQERHDEAHALLDELIRRDQLEPVDQAWVLVQRARVRADVGDIAGARGDAVDVQRHLVGDNDDLTGSALAAAAAGLLFTTAGLGQGTLGDTLTASDTAVSWWRSQTISWALEEGSVRAFRSWAQDRAHRWSRGDPVSRNLFAAELNADVSGEHGTWRAISALAARHQLMTASSGYPQTLAEALDALRRSGDAASLELAASHLWKVGPAGAVAAAVSRIPAPESWTHTTAMANFELWKVAGDLAAPSGATKAALWSLGVLRGESTAFVERVRPTFILKLPAAGALASLLTAAEPEVHEAAAQLLCGPGEVPDYLSSSFSQVARSLDLDKVSPEGVRSLVEFGATDHGDIGSAVLGALADHGDERAKREVVARASAGELGALAAMGSITALEEAGATRLVGKFEDMVRTTVEDANRSTYGFGVFDGGRGLALFNLWFPSIARWEALLALLRDRRVAAEHKRGACEVIVASVDRLPADVRAQLALLIDDLKATQSLGVPGGRGMGGLPVSIAVAIGVLDAAEADRAAVRLAGGTVHERRDVAELLGRGWCKALRPLLASLAADEQVEVRVDSAHWIGRLASTDPEDEIMAGLAQSLSEDRGVLVPRALITGIGRGGQNTPERFGALVNRLLLHPAATVRHTARRVAQRIEHPSVDH
jgi:hypothetical protein